MKKQVIFGIALALAILSCLPMQGQEKVVPLKYGNMDHWVIRNIKESAIIGGNQKTIYAVGPNMTIHGNTPYTNKGGSPWAHPMFLRMFPAFTRPIIRFIATGTAVAIAPNWRLI